MNCGTCKSCGSPIRWIKMRSGKYMPCDIKPVDYQLKPGGSQKIVTPAGDVVTCERVSAAQASGWGYTPHWSTCKAPDTFRKGAGE